MLTVVLKRDITFVMFHQNDLKAEIDMHTTLNNFFLNVKTWFEI